MSEASAIRAARPDEAEVLSALARASKASWGYDQHFMRACRAELTVTRADILAHPTRIFERNGQPVAFHQLRLEGDRAEVWLFFVAPAWLGHGIGRALWQDLERCAVAAGAKRVEVDADPHAEGFYRAMGMTRIGCV